MRLRVLTWNLFHGRAVPAAGRDLSAEFTAALGEWSWDVALLQEVPPWWPAALAADLECEMHAVLTSRNGAPWLRRAAARRAPDLLKSGGGGANAILARFDRIAAARAQRLCWWPERRWVHGVRLGSGAWVCNLHASTGDPARTARDVSAALIASRVWAQDAPLVVGGDLNLRTLDGDGLRVVASSDVDHVLVSARADVVGEAVVLQSGALSDHAPLAVTLELG